MLSGQKYIVMDHRLFALPIMCIITILITGCDIREVKKNKIQALPNLMYLDTIIDGSKILTIRFDYYLISYNLDDTSAENNYVQYFVNTNSDTGVIKKYDQYEKIFYKESDSTNIKRLEIDKDIIDKYSNQHDLKYEYIWEKGNFVGKFKYNNGHIISPSGKIEIKDIQDSTKKK